MKLIIINFSIVFSLLSYANNHNATQVEIEDFQYNNIKISSISKSYAIELFNELASKKHIPFEYLEDACYARAHEMSILLEQKGIITAKLFIEGEGGLQIKTNDNPNEYIEWDYHVAPIIMINDGGRDELYVIDPSIFSSPVPIQEWFEIQTNHKYGKHYKTYKTKRYIYTPSKRYRQLKTYDPNDIHDMNKTMVKFANIIEQDLIKQ